MELEELKPSKLIGPHQDIETIESWAERNGLTFGTARAWVIKGVVPTVKLGKRRMVNTAYGQVLPPTACTGLRLFCLLVTNRDGQARSLPIHTQRPMPPRACPPRSHPENASCRWFLDLLSVPVGNHPGLYLRETHAKRPTAQVLERCGKHRQAAARTFSAGGVAL